MSKPSADLPTWESCVGDGPLLAVAIHDGHFLRPEVAAATALSDADRLREEDPYTGEMARLAPTWLVPVRSRFEVDLNRGPEAPVYLGPDQAWGLDVWKQPPAESLLRTSRAYYDAFYAAYREQVDRLLLRHERVCVLDLHSYNHRRRGPGQPVDDPELNPEINLGTGTLNRVQFGALADVFSAGMRRLTLDGRPLDVRENVKFRGGYLSRWTHEHYPERVGVLAVEFKKIFMDEWTGELDRRIWGRLKDAVEALLPALGHALQQKT